MTTENKLIKEIIYTEEEIQTRIKEIAAEIERVEQKINKATLIPVQEKE